jgi:hypothetical protein
MATYIPNVTDVFPKPATFTPDFSLIDKVLQRREAQYEKGFSKINQLYNFVNRETLNPLNTKVKEQFLRQAKDNLKNLASLDLSLPENVSAAGEVFSPFYKNTNIIGDQMFTAYTNQQKSLGESYRNQDGGKLYHEDNVRVIARQQEQFAQDTPDNWQKYWGNKMGYTPYYNVDEERMKLMEKFKPSRKQTILKDGFYITKVDDESWTQGEIENYLKNAYSEKAKQQLRIHGIARYGDNLPLLAQNYTNVANQQIPSLDKEIQEIEADIKKERDPNKLTKLEADLNFYKDQKDRLSSNLDIIKAGDMSLIKQKADELADDLFFKEHVATVSSAYVHEDIEKDLSFDQVAMMFWKNDQDWAMKEWERKNKVADDIADRAFQKELAATKEKAEKEKGYLGLIPGSGGDKTVVTSKTMLNYKIKEKSHEVDKSRETLSQHIRIVMGWNAGREISTKEFYDYVRSHPKDTIVADFVRKSNARTAMVRTYASWNKNANNYALSKMGEKKFMRLYELKQAGQTNTAEYVVLNKAYNTYFSEYNDPKYTSVTSSNVSFGLNPKDSRFADKAGIISAYSGLDATLLAGIFVDPDISGQIDVRFTVQKDPNKASWETDDLIDNMNDKLAASGAKVEQPDPKKNEFVIRNAPKELFDDIDPYYGLDVDTRIVLSALHNRDVPNGGMEEENITIADNFNYNRSFKVTKVKTPTGDVNYYIYNNKNRLLSTQPYASTQEVGQNIRALVMRNTPEELTKLLNLPPSK